MAVHIPANDELDEMMDAAAEEQVVEIDTSDEAFDKDLATYRQLRDERDKLNDLLSDNSKALTEVETRIIYIMNARGITQLRKANVGTLSVVPNPFPKVLDLEAMITWLDTHGEGGIAKRSINANTLRAWVKEKKENLGELPPPEIMEDRAGQSLRLRRPTSG